MADISLCHWVAKIGKHAALHACVMMMPQAGLMVDVLAFGGSQPSSAFASCQNIRIHCIPEAYALTTFPDEHCRQVPRVFLMTGQHVPQVAVPEPAPSHAGPGGQGGAAGAPAAGHDAVLAALPGPAPAAGPSPMPCPQEAPGAVDQGHAIACSQSLVYRPLSLRQQGIAWALWHQQCSLTRDAQGKCGPGFQDPWLQDSTLHIDWGTVTAAFSADASAARCGCRSPRPSPRCRCAGWRAPGTARPS